MSRFWALSRPQRRAVCVVKSSTRIRLDVVGPIFVNGYLPALLVLNLSKDGQGFSHSLLAAHFSSTSRNKSCSSPATVVLHRVVRV
jgi:hypothetical protein